MDSRFSHCSAPCLRHGPSPLLEVSTGLATTQECSGETCWHLGPPGWQSLTEATRSYVCERREVWMMIGDCGTMASEVFVAGMYERVVIGVSMEQRRNKMAEETGDPRENPPTSSIVWHDSHNSIYPHEQICISCIVPKAKQIPSYMNIAMPFSRGTWVLYWCSSIVLGGTWKVIARYDREEVSRSRTFADAVRLMVLGNTYYNPISAVQRLFVLWCLVCNLVMSSLYQGFLSSCLTQPHFYPDINSFKELFATYLPISLPIADADSEEYFENTEFDDDTIELIGRAVNIADDAEAFGMMMRYRNVSRVYGKFPALYEVSRPEYYRNGFPMLHVIDSCYYNFPVVLFSESSSNPFLHRINTISVRLGEAGIITKVRREYVEESRKKTATNKLTLEPVDAADHDGRNKTSRRHDGGVWDGTISKATPSYFRPIDLSLRGLESRCGRLKRVWSGAGRNEGAGETEDPRENPLINGIDTCENPVIRQTIEPGSPWWEASGANRSATRPNIRKPRSQSPAQPIGEEIYVRIKGTSTPFRFVLIHSEGAGVSLGSRVRKCTAGRNVEFRFAIKHSSHHPSTRRASLVCFACASSIRNVSVRGNSTILSKFTHGPRPVYIHAQLLRFCWERRCRQVHRHDENTARLARRSDEALGVRASVAHPRENPPNNGIVQHDSHLRKSGDPGRVLNPVRLGVKTRWISSSCTLKSPLLSDQSVHARPRRL
ncbi:hypothetical protein PR048_025275 [Dryococelus australis]|uniref:Ionotropic glutamate receptor C-terminal domain-containing protein n=1 Tax=Dryococelus australis TaxID=614101 RepID=A0ABQ9GQV2_9NEOP|nr:hypothetical protein PR048_025275 [Dryococelus australis]